MNDGKKYIVRSNNAGVFFGEIKERIGEEITMGNVRRLWYWSGAASLSQLAMEGVNRKEDCKFTMYVPEITIFGVIEIIPCTEKAIANIKEVKEWKV
jgi:hypothetical protein